MEKIWCLFSVDNAYDQPNNNLVCWWPERPSIEKLGATLKYPLEKATDETTVALVTIWQGTPSKFVGVDTWYRLQPVAQDTVL